MDTEYMYINQSYFKVMHGFIFNLLYFELITY